MRIVKTFYAEGSAKSTKGMKNGYPFDIAYDSLSTEDKTTYDNFYSTFSTQVISTITGYPEVIDILKFTDVEPGDDPETFVYEDLSQENKDLIAAFAALI